MESRAFELFAKRNGKISVRAIPGHFATQHSHVNYCIDMTRVKTEMNAAKAAAKLFAESFTNVTVDTIITLERTKMVGAFIAEELASGSGLNMNQEIAVISPEITADEKLILRDNMLPYVRFRHVLLLTATVRGIRYYGGEVAGVATVFGGMFEIPGVPVVRLIGAEDLPDYSSYRASDCPLCRSGRKVDALVNSYGYSRV